jgi:hypothetical protein
MPEASKHKAEKPKPEEPTPKALEPRRNRQAELLKAKSRMSESLALVRLARDAGELDREVLQVAQSLILCGLPYRPTESVRTSRKARLADGSTVTVTFTAAIDGIALPFGSDRTVLHFLFDRAIKSGKRYVSWETAKEFIDAMGMQKNGKNYADLRARFSRIRGLAISVVRAGPSGESTMVMPIIRRSHLPNSVDMKADRSGKQLLPLSKDVVFGVEIDAEFFEELKLHHVPVPSMILQSTRKQSQLQDLMLFLYWRCYAAASESLIPWTALHQQLWQEDKKVSRIKGRFTEAIKALAIIWPEIQAEAQPEGLLVGPPRRGVQLLTHGKKSKRIESHG